MKKDIFISYENEGLHLAMLLSNSLNENGYDVYFNPNELNSVAFPNRLRNAIESCKDFLLILTQSCIERLMDENIIYWVREELFIAHRSGKNIIPIIMPDVVMPNDEENIPENLKFLLRLDRLCIIQQSNLDKIIESVVEMLTSVPSNFSHNQEQKYIFISYSHRDSDIVVPIIKKMKSYGYSVWYDDGIDPGTEWDKNIAEHVENCGYFIAFMSENYINSSNCKDELNFARDLEKKRFLVYIEEVELPSEMKMRLSRIQNIHKYKYKDDRDFFNKFFSAHGLDEFKGVEKTVSFYLPLKIGDDIRFGQYKQENTTEDIIWTVLEIDNEKALIISKKTLDCQPYITGKQKANWQQSHIRRWLNNTFYLMAFSKDEQDRILSVQIDEVLDKTGCVDCYDKVLLLNCEEAEKYFKYDEDRLSEPTEYAASLGAKTGDWWLKSGSYCDGVYDDSTGGEISWCNTYNCYRGVKPCLWIKM